MVERDTVQRWIPSLAMLLLSMLILATGLWRQDQQGIGEHRALLERVPDRFSCTWGEHQFGIHLHSGQSFLTDLDGHRIGRLDDQEAAAIRNSLHDARILQRLDAAELNEAQRQRYGLHKAVSIDLQGKTHQFGSARTDRGYCLLDGQLLVLSTDPAAVLGRHPNALRDHRLHFPDVLSVVEHGSGWRLHVARRRWWLQRNGSQTDEWTEAEQVLLWIKNIVQMQVHAFTSPSTNAVRAKLTLHGQDMQGQALSMHFEDLGPAKQAGMRVIRRVQTFGEHDLIEYLLCESDGLLFDPAAESFLSKKLFPLDPSTAKRVVFGKLDMRRDDTTWTINNSNDVDQLQVNSFLGRLASLERLPKEPLGPATQTVRIETDNDQITLGYDDPRLQDVITKLRAWHYANRYILPGVSADRIRGLVFAPRDDTPRIFSRNKDGSWPAEDAADVRAFIAILLKAKVSNWTHRWQQGQDQPFAHEVTITVSTDAQTYTLRLNSAGQVLIPERSIAGQLDAHSRRQLMEE